MAIINRTHRSSSRKRREFIHSKEFVAWFKSRVSYLCFDCTSLCTVMSSLVKI